MNKKAASFLLLSIATCVIINCSTVVKTPVTYTKSADTLTLQNILKTAPVIPAENSISKMTVEDGFEVKLVASEPLVSTPVALNFDNKNRMWVLEMENYMPDIEGYGENKPTSKIVILEDTNKDGVADKRKLFLDSLLLPRAICLIENGILVAEPPKLWYYEIVNDKPGKRTLIDEEYTQGENVEAMANGLYRALDNWIYSAGAGSEKRYRKRGDKWLIERTHARGQWGISQDDEGRLYYNNNSQNLLGDYFSPGLGASNTNLQSVKGFNERIVSDNRVYPARPTPGVNRGYKEGILDNNMKLKALTAACGPLIYRGDLFGQAYYGNAFITEPAANIIKRNILKQTGNITTGDQAYEGKEFLSSVDERFRPVTLYNGPDGALYVLDMYRGIIEHKAFMTDYLKKEIQKRNLDQVTTCGRIYKITPQNKPAKAVIMPNDPQKLVNLLQHPNGWIRDRAQQTLVDGKLQQAVPHLRKLLQSTQAVTVSHALWTMEGLGVLQPADILPLLQHADRKVKIQALSALSSVVNQQTYAQYIPVLKQMIGQDDPVLAPYLAFQMQGIKTFNKALANEMLLSLAKKYPEDQYVSDAILSNLQKSEAEFLKQLSPTTLEKSYINQRFNKVLADISSNLKNRDINLLKKQYPRGASLFFSTCQACHGANGNGVQSLAPPLNHSEWVTGPKSKLISIVLFGLTGPVKVNNKVYKAPEINGDMPGIGANKDILDEDIAQLLSFIRNSWNNTAERITREEVIQVRKKFSGRETPFTAEELDKLTD